MKSFILSAVLISSIIIFFMSVLDSKVNNFVRNLPEWFAWIGVAIFFIGFLLSLYWGITGIFKGQRLLNCIGIGCSVFGLALYAFFYVLETGRGKETAGQFDHELSKIEASQKQALDTLLAQTNTQPTDVQIVPYWGMNNNTSSFALCIQKGNIIALQIKGKPLNDVKAVAAFKHLNWLILENCGLKSIDGLNLPLLQRLAINYNNITSLSGIENSPQIAWLNYRNNPVTDSAALQHLTNNNLFISGE